MSIKKDSLKVWLKSWIERNPPIKEESVNDRQTRAYRELPNGILMDAINRDLAVRRLFNIVFNRVAGIEFNQRITPFLTTYGERREFVDVERSEIHEAWQAFELRRKNVRNAKMKMKKEALKLARVYKEHHPDINISVEKIAALLQEDMEDIA